MASGSHSEELRERLPGGYLQFFDEIAVPMLEERSGMELFYGMVSPVESPHDTPQMNLVRAKEAKPSTVVGDLYLETLKRTKQLGGYTTRLVVTPGPRSRLPVSEVEFMRAIYSRAHAEGGEVLRRASFTEQVPRLYTESSYDTQLADAYVDGVRARSPDGGFWAIYEARGTTWPLVVANVIYDQGVFMGFDVSRRQALRREGQQPISLPLDTYARFWHEVFYDKLQSTAVLPK